MTRQVELEAAIEANPDSADAYLVYADWLQSRGDPLGELIVLQHAGKHAEATAFIATHHLLGALEGFAEAKPARRSRHVLALDWQFGFVRKAHIGWETSRTKRAEAAQDFAAFLELPVARFVQELTIGPAPADDFMVFDFLLELIARAGKPSALRTLVAGDIGHWDISTTETGPFTQVVDVLPHLRSLTARAGNITLGRIAHPELRELAIQTGGIGSVIDEVCASELPRLERLELWLGTPNYGGTTEIADLAQVLDGTRFPHVKHLGLMNAVITDEIAITLATSKILPQLTSLDLSMGTLSDAGIRAMLAARTAFAHLDLLELDDNALDATATLPEVSTLANRVNVGTRHDPERATGEPAERYSSVGE